MANRIAPIFMLSYLAAFGCSESLAAPAQLYGKSVVVSWTEERIQRDLGKEKFRPSPHQGGFSVYVSSAGHIFNRMSIAAGHRSGSSDRLGAAGNRNISFQGNSMSSVQQSQGGARRILITFDQQFASCTAEVIRGKETGASRILARSKLRPGVRVEIQSVRTGAASCSVRNGNVFGGE
jgi:hypothetical protein